MAEGMVKRKEGEDELVIKLPRTRRNDTMETK